MEIKCTHSTLSQTDGTKKFKMLDMGGFYRFDMILDDIYGADIYVNIEIKKDNDYKLKFTGYLDTSLLMYIDNFDSNQGPNTVQEKSKIHNAYKLELHAMYFIWL